MKKIISGGQVGVDISALKAAKELGVATGGWMPQGFMTEEGPHPEYAELYGLKEHQSPKYPPRTEQNILESDGTLVIANDLQSSGTRLTIHLCAKLRKPCRIVAFEEPVIMSLLYRWIKENHIEVLNVAGNRESKAPGIGDYTYYLISILIKETCNEVA